MKADPVSLLAAQLVRDGVNGTLTLRVEVPHLGRVYKGVRKPPRVALTVYDVRVSPRYVFLTRRGTGQLYTVTKAGRSCSCGDATYRTRGLVTACKHTAALEAVGMLQE